MYLYTGAIDFAPFGSGENRRSRSAEIVTLADGDVPRPSPKSIYRLADKVRTRPWERTRDGRQTFVTVRRPCVKDLGTGPHPWSIGKVRHR